MAIPHTHGCDYTLAIDIILMYHVPIPVGLVISSTESKVAHYREVCTLNSSKRLLEITGDYWRARMQFHYYMHAVNLDIWLTAM